MTPRQLLTLGALLATAEMAVQDLGRRSRIGKRLHADLAACRAEILRPLEAAAAGRLTAGIVAALDVPAGDRVNGEVAGHVDLAAQREAAEVAAGFCEHEVPRTKVCPVCSVGAFG